MSKVYNKIVQSNTEPSKNDVWLKDGQMKTFGKEGWKTVGGGSPLDANTPIKESVDGTELIPIFDGENKAVNINELVKGGKEVYYIDVEKYKSSIGRLDYENLREKINNPNTILVTTYEGSNYTLNLEEITDFSFYLTGSIALTYNKIKILYFNISEEYGIGLMPHLSTKILTFDQSGDGTKFLSDDGTYKTIDITSLQTQITALGERIAALEGGDDSGVTLPNEYLKITCECGTAYLNVDDRDNIYWITYGNINGIEPDGKNLYLTEASGDIIIEFEANVGGFAIDGESIEPNSVKSLTLSSTFNIDLGGLYNVAKIYIGGL